jgi:hypothetical protein
LLKPVFARANADRIAANDKAIGLMYLPQLSMSSSPHKKEKAAC